MSTLFTLLVFIATLGVLVTVHEFGHFWVARRCGVKVLRFCVGFGTPIVSWTDKQGTEYGIAAIPLGGYVKMLDEREAPVEPDEQHLAFNRKHPFQRILIAAAGPVFNFILAVLAYWLVMLNGQTGAIPVIAEVKPNSLAEVAGVAPGQEIVSIDGHPTPVWEQLGLRLMDRLGESGTLSITVKDPGDDREYRSEVELDRWMIGDPEPNPIEGLGIRLFTPKVDLVLAEVIEGSAAARDGFKAGDKLVSLNGTEVASWREWARIIRNNPGTTLDAEVEREGELIALSLTPARHEDKRGNVCGRAGVAATGSGWPEGSLRTYEYGLVNGFIAAVSKTEQMTMATLNGIRKIITGELSTKNLSGPVTIAKVAGERASYGFQSWLGILALLSVSLGVLNLLPVPVLDGGHIGYAIAEWIKGSPLSERAMAMTNYIGLFLVAALMVLALYNDILRVLFGFVGDPDLCPQ